MIVIFVMTHLIFDIMATISLRLSPKSDNQTHLHEIMIRFSHGQNICQRADTGYKIKEEYWQEAVFEEGKRKVLTPAGIRTDFRTWTEEKKSIILLNNDLMKLCEYVQKTFQADIEKQKNVAIDPHWLQNTIQAYHNPIVEEVEEEVEEESEEIQEREPQKTFFEVFESFVANVDVSKNRRAHYNVVMRCLKRFELFIDTTISFESFTPDFIHEFEEFLSNEHLLFELPQYKAICAIVTETRKPIPRGRNTIIDILKKVRAFIIWANNNNYSTTNPFGRDKFTIGECIYGTPYYLTIEERNSLYNYDFSENKHLEISRDIFIFQCVIGCRVSDLWAMTKSNVIDDCIEYIAQKTKKERANTIVVPLNKIGKDILKKYEDYEGLSLFPFPTQQQYNVDIKAMMKKANISRVVTIINPTTRKEEKRPICDIASSHIARRTFIGNLYKKVQDPNVIGSMSGHVEGSKAFARYRDIDKETKISVVSMIE